MTSPVATLAEGFYAFSSTLDRLARRLAGACILGMLSVMMLQVAARYVFASPPFWTEELARWLMVWGGLLGATCAFRLHADPAMVTPPADVVWRQKAQAVARFVAAWLFFAPVLWYCIPYLERQLGRTSDGLQVSTAWMAMALPVTCLLMLIHGLAGLGVLVSKNVLEKESALGLHDDSNMLE